MATRTERSLLLEREKQTKKPPPFYKVLLFNDDFTTTDFVVDVLQRFFAMDVARATRVMLQVHHEGKAVCGVYPHDIAETKVAQVTDYARQSGHPLRCGMEEQ
jgi:ATP-dependent Clp protease adaptor protein ClpS